MKAAERGGADYLFFGPVFATLSKAAYGTPQGLGRLAEVCNAVAVPVLAIGGITLENAADCLSAGASGIAAIMECSTLERCEYSTPLGLPVVPEV